MTRPRKRQSRRQRQWQKQFLSQYNNSWQYLTHLTILAIVGNSGNCSPILNDFDTCDKYYNFWQFVIWHWHWMGSEIWYEIWRLRACINIRILLKRAYFYNVCFQHHHPWKSSCLWHNRQQFDGVIWSSQQNSWNSRNSIKNTLTVLLYNICEK